MVIVQLFNRERPCSSVRRLERKIPTGQSAFDLRLLDLLPDRDVLRLAGRCAAPLGRWSRHRVTLGCSLHIRCTGRRDAVHRSGLPADPRPRREVQHSAVCDGRVRSASSGSSTKSPEPPDPEIPVVLDRVRGDIEFRECRPSGTIPSTPCCEMSRSTSSPVKSVAIVGATGAGKTSLISIMSRFYDIQKGQYSARRRRHARYAPPDVRKHIGTVLQDAVLFSGTVTSNIRLHNTSITDREVRGRRGLRERRQVHRTAFRRLRSPVRDGARTSPLVSGSSSPSPVLSRSIPRCCWSSTRRPRASTPKPRRSSRMRWSG